MALAKDQRLSRTKDIERVFLRSRRYETPEFLLRVHKKNGLPGRAAVVISKKVAKKAVERNRLRRRLTEWLRLDLRIGSLAVDCILSVKPKASILSRKELASALSIFKTQLLNS